MTVWHPISDNQIGYLFSLSESLKVYESSNPGIFHTLDQSPMWVASDYSGQHKDASHESYTFLVTSELLLRKWLPQLHEFRQRHLPDGRRLSFKRLNDNIRWKALPRYLSTMGNFEGTIITIMVDKRVGSFFFGGPANAIVEFPDCFSKDAKKRTVEKMFRLASFVSFILCGLRNESQVSHWISDHDEALDSHSKREQFSRLASYLTFGATGWFNPADHYFGTTELPTAPPWAEDFAAITDLVAGASSKMSSSLPSFFGENAWTVRMDSDDVKDDRSRAIGTWLASPDKKLKHVLLRLEKDNHGAIRSSAQSFIRKEVRYLKN